MEKIRDFNSDEFHSLFYNELLKTIDKKINEGVLYNVNYIVTTLLP